MYAKGKGSAVPSDSQAREKYVSYRSARIEREREREREREISKFNMFINFPQFETLFLAWML